MLAEVQKTETLGNTTEFASGEEFATRYSYTALRFYLLSIARSLLPNHRIQVCWRYPLPERDNIEIIYSDERQRARARGTMKCGSGWVCPACMSYITEQRREELKTALERAREHYYAVMVTYTIRHSQADRLAPLLAQMQDAFSKLKSGRAWQTLKAEFMLVGGIRATEITYGDSGWHPHYHELVFVKNEVLKYVDGDVSEFTKGLEGHLKRAWREKLERVGLSASLERGVTVRSSSGDVADYIAKFGKMPRETDFAGQTDEITRGTTKAARGGNFGVLDIVFLAANNKRFAGLFREYEAATKGRSQLQWSRGLKSLLSIEIIRDEKAAEGVETDTDRLLAAIDLPLWRHISHRGFLGQLMTIAHEGDGSKLEAYLGHVREHLEGLDSVSLDFDNWSMGH